jgi:hypothetical protein
MAASTAAPADRRKLRPPQHRHPFCPAGSPRMERLLRLMDSGEVTVTARHAPMKLDDSSRLRRSRPAPTAVSRSRSSPEPETRQLFELAK